jgi:hypothetical protein
VGNKFIQSLIGEPEEKRPLGRSMRRWSGMNLTSQGKGIIAGSYEYGNIS